MKKILSLLVTFFTVTVANADNNLNGYIGVVDGGSGNGPIGNYTWSATTSNLMTCFTFDNGELADYTTLKFTISNISGGMVRVGYYVGNAWTELGSGFGSDGDKTVDLTGIADRSTITKISFGGRTLNNGSVPGTVNLRNMYLTNDSGDKVYATYSTPATNASFYDYKWTATTNNLATLYSFSKGELAKYTTLTFTLSNKSDGAGSVRIGYYVGSTWTEFTNDDGNQGFGTTGTKTIHLYKQNVDLSTVTKISFGGKTDTGSINIRNITLSNDALDRTFTIGQKSTVCLPYDLTEEEATAAGKFYELSEADATSLKFTEVAAPVAYTPYVFVPAVDNPFVSLDKTAASHVGKACEVVVGNYTFKGTMTSVPDVAAANTGKTCYGYNAADGTFVKVGTDVSINAFRAYITVPGEVTAHELDINFGDGDVTAIKTVKHETIADSQYYNLNGQRVSANHKGLVIANGKKYMMK